MKKNTTTIASVLAVVLVLSLALTGVGQATQFVSATTIGEEDINDEEVPTNTIQSVTDTHNAIVASIDATTDIPDEFNSRWTNPGTVAGDGGVTLFVVDCLPGEYPATPQYMLAEGVGILQQFVIGSGSDYLSMLYLVANFGDEDQVVKMGVTCIDEDGNESGDGDNDDESSVTRVTNNNFVTNIINNIVNNINTNVTIITNNTNVTIIPPPDNNTTDPGGNTTDPGGNTTDPGTGGNTTDPGTGGNTTLLTAPITNEEPLTDPGTTEPATENTTDTTADATPEEETEETPVEEETTTEEETTAPTTPTEVEEETEEEETETAEEETTTETTTEESATPTTTGGDTNEESPTE